MSRQEILDLVTSLLEQTKAPMASLQSKEKDETIQKELFHMEQNADMALGFLYFCGETQDETALREKMKDTFEKTDLDPILRSSIQHFSPLLARKGIQVEYEGTGRTLLTNGRWLRFILDQILSNAVHFTKEGKITIRIHEKRLEIVDTGVGIRQEDFPHIFEKGFVGGNGLEAEHAAGHGLYLSYQMAYQLGMMMTVFSSLGGGTCVQLSLPPEA